MISVDVLDLGSVTLPDRHPRAADRTCPIQGFAVSHPDGVVVFDTGVGAGNAMIDELYHPVVVPVADALDEVGIDERDVAAIVNSHLHFDHCGQNHALPAVPVWVQRGDHRLIHEPLFTIAEWATVPPDRLRLLDGDVELVEGVDIVATPGHTPGHQSLAVDVAGDLVVLGGQCCYTCAEFAGGVIAEADCHDDDWIELGHESLRRLAALAPVAVHLSHDREIWRPS